jgi:hypothetical protein
MRNDRRSQGGSAGGLARGLLFMLSALAVGMSARVHASTGASPSAEATASVDASPAPTASETPTPAPSASPGFDCRTAFANVEDFYVLREATVWVQVRGFPANAPVTVSFVSAVEQFERPIGAATTDEHGNADTPITVPTDAPFGDSYLRVRGTEDCASDAYIVVVPALEDIRIDDATVVPGQRVTIAATGFAPEEIVTLYLDSDPRDALSRTREIASARTSSDGSVLMTAHIPRDISLGEHFLLLNGWSFDHSHDLGLFVEIEVISAGTLPPTDT